MLQSWAAGAACGGRLGVARPLQADQSAGVHRRAGRKCSEAAERSARAARGRTRKLQSRSAKAARGRTHSRLMRELEPKYHGGASGRLRRPHPHLCGAHPPPDRTGSSEGAHQRGFMHASLDSCRGQPTSRELCRAPPAWLTSRGGHELTGSGAANAPPYKTVGSGHALTTPIPLPVVIDREGYPRVCRPMPTA